MTEMIYIYKWKNNSKRINLYNRLCMVIRYLRMNSCIIKFIDNGQLECVSRNSLKKIKDK